MLLAAAAMPVRRPGELARTSVALAAPMAVPPAFVTAILREAVTQLPGLADDRAVSIDFVGGGRSTSSPNIPVRFFSGPSRG